VVDSTRRGRGKRERAGGGGGGGEGGGGGGGGGGLDLDGLRTRFDESCGKMEELGTRLKGHSFTVYREAFESAVSDLLQRAAVQTATLHSLRHNK